MGNQNEIGERFMSGDIDRRSVVKLLALAAAAGIVTTSSLRGARAAAKSVRFDGWGGVAETAFHDAAFTPFTSETGIDVVMGTFGEENEFLTKARVSEPGTYNLAFSAGTTMYKRYIDLGLGSELNADNIPNLKLVMDGIVKPFLQISNNRLSAVPFDYSTTGIAYNKKYVTEEEVAEKGFGILLDKKYEGKLGASTLMQDRVWWGALQTGQDPNAINDIEAVWAKIREGRPLVKKYWASGAEFVEMMTKEEIIVSDAWSPRTGSLIAQGAPVGFYNPPKAQGWIEDFFVLKGSPIAECEKLLNLLLEPKVAVAVWNAGYKAFPVLDPNKVKFPEEILSAAGFDRTGTLSKLLIADAAVWTPNMDAWQAKWDRVAKGG